MQNIPIKIHNHSKIPKGKTKQMKNTWYPNMQLDEQLIELTHQFTKEKRRKEKE